MSLQQNISTSLNAQGLVSALTTTLSSSAGSLNSLTLPVDSDQLRSIGSGADFDSGAILTVVRQAAEQAAPLLAELPSPAAPLQQISTVLEAVEQITTQDLGASFTALTDRLTAEFEGDTKEGFIGILLRVMEVLSTAPEASALKTLLSDLTTLAGVSVNMPEGMGELLPGIVNAVRVLGGLMTLESILSETQRLTGIVAQQLDPSQAQEAIDRVVTAVEDGSLASRIFATDPTDSGAVEAAISGGVGCAERLESAEGYISRGMGFGEATLAYLDVDKMRVELELAKALLRDADLSQLESLIRGATDGLRPILQIDLSAVPSQPLEAVLSMVEAQIDQYAAQITAFDPQVITGPLVSGLDEVSRLLHSFSDLLTQALQEIRGILDGVRQAVASLPFDTIVSTVKRVLEPVQQALEAIRRLVEEIRAALETAANAAIAALAKVEGGVDEFVAKINDLFDQARKVIDALPVDQALGTIAENIKAFNDALAAVDMKPIFDNASGAIGTTADVIEKVPFSLLPDSMKGEVDEALKPIREVNAEEVKSEIKGLLGISSEGKFELRPRLEGALADVQKKFEELVKTIEEHNPRVYLQTIDHELAAITTRIQALSPDLSLEPVRQAIDSAKEAIGSFDLNHELEPLHQVFQQLIDTLQSYSPVALIQPIEQRVNDARNSLIGAIRFDQWTPALDDISKRALELLDIVDPDLLEEQITALLHEVDSLVKLMPDTNPAAWLGNFLADLLRGTGARIYPTSFNAILGWVTTGSAASDLRARATSISDNLARTKAAVDAVDTAALSTRLISAMADLRPAISSLAGRLSAGSPQRLRLEAAGARLDFEARFAVLTSNRSRYLTVLNSAASLAESISSLGVSEADIAIRSIGNAVAPLRDIMGVFRTLLGHVGITGFEDGLRGVLQAFLEAVPASRLAGLVVPLIKALRGRLKELVDSILTAIKNGINEIKTLVALIDLAPLRESLEAVFQEVLTQINTLNPMEILKESLEAFAKLKEEVSNFDPLATILNLLNQLRETIVRVLEKLSAEKLLATPIAIYDTIVRDLRVLNVETLLEPVLDQLDAIAQGVSTGLDETITAFERLQQALPAPSSA